MYICNDKTLASWLLTLHLGTYIMLIVPTFVAFFLLDDFVFYLTALFLLPQIIKNAKDCQKYKTKPWIIAGIIIPKLLMLGYLRLDPNNIFRYSPKLNVVIGVVAVILIQVIFCWIKMIFIIQGDHFAHSNTMAKIWFRTYILISYI